jgi:hypothetical protein
LAFTPDTIEIRLIINGNLVHTMTMPDLQLITSKVSKLRPLIPNPQLLPDSATFTSLPPRH